MYIAVLTALLLYIIFCLCDSNKRYTDCAVSILGGKDSTVLAYVMKLLNERYNYGLNLVLLSVDEGITGYRDDSLETVKRNQVSLVGVDEIIPYMANYVILS